MRANTEPLGDRANFRPWSIAAICALLWLFLYNVIQPLSEWISYRALGLARGSHAGEAVAFFLYDVPKIMLLVSGMIFVITVTLAIIVTGYLFQPGLVNCRPSRKNAMKDFKVLGSGCSRCIATAKLIEDIAQVRGVEVQVEKITDLTRILGYGVMSTPGVVIDGAVVHAGGEPARSKVEAWLAK